MSEQLDLETYRVQLQQVEAALEAEPDNEELQKLKEDLEEVISLTEEVVKSNAVTTAATSSTASDSQQKGGQPTGSTLSNIQWRVGDKCLAQSRKNKQYYEAVIEGISNGQAAITYIDKKITDVNDLSQLRPIDEKWSKKKDQLWGDARKGSRFEAEREKKRKKALKRQQHWKQLEEEKEADKKRWKDFRSRAIVKSYKGVQKSSTLLKKPDQPTRAPANTAASSKKLTPISYKDDKMHYSTF